MEEIILIGGGGHCRSIIDVLELSNKYKILGILDNKISYGDSVLGYKVLGKIDNIKNYSKSCNKAVISIGQIYSSSPKIEIFNILKSAGFELPTIISPRAHISRFAQIGEGTVIFHDVIVNSNAILGKNCIINTKAIIEHDATIVDHCHISTSAIINGGVSVGDRTFVGSGSVTKEYANIPSDSFIKAGSVFK